MEAKREFTKISHVNNLRHRRLYEFVLQQPRTEQTKRGVYWGIDKGIVSFLFPLLDSRAIEIIRIPKKKIKIENGRVILRRGDFRAGVRDYDLGDTQYEELRLALEEVGIWKESEFPESLGERGGKIRKYGDNLKKLIVRKTRDYGSSLVDLLDKGLRNSPKYPKYYP